MNVDGKSIDVASMPAQLGFEERDNKFQQLIVGQLLAAQQALAACHENVLLHMTRKLDATRQVEVENHLLNEKIAAIGGPSSSSSCYRNSASARSSESSCTQATESATLNSRPLQPGNMPGEQYESFTSLDAATAMPPSPPPNLTLTAVVPEGEPCGMYLVSGESNSPDVLAEAEKTYQEFTDAQESAANSFQCSPSILSVCQIGGLEDSGKPDDLLSSNSSDAVHKASNGEALQPGQATETQAGEDPHTRSMPRGASPVQPNPSAAVAASCVDSLLHKQVKESQHTGASCGILKNSSPNSAHIRISQPMASVPRLNGSHSENILATSEQPNRQLDLSPHTPEKTAKADLITSGANLPHSWGKAPSVTLTVPRDSKDIKDIGSFGMAAGVSKSIHQMAQSHKSRSLQVGRGNFVVMDEWHIEELDGINKARVSKRRFSNMDLIRNATNLIPLSRIDENDDRSILHCCKKAVLHPCGGKRATWDMFSLALVTYDMVMLPLQLFDPPASMLSETMAWVTRVFWTVDMPISICTGYLLSDGSIQMHPGEVAKRYLLTWFLLDTLLVLLDWLELIISVRGAESASEYSRIGKMGRTFRIVRMVRLLRLVRMREIIKLVTFRMQSERLVIMADIAKILGIIIAIAHLMACVWYGIADEDNPTNSWIGGETNRTVLDMNLEHKYLISLHWAVSQFSGGMDEFRAKNLMERFYNVTVFLAAFMMAAVCVSGLTSSMTRLHILSSHQSRQLSTLRRYLLQNGISDRLALRVQRNALHAISEQQRLMAEKNVELLQAVSEPLRVELHFEMYSPVLEVHCFFLKYIQECPQVMMRVSHQAMSTLLVSSGDVVFNAGEIPDHPKFYIVCNGQMEYIPSSGSVTRVCAEEWLSEGALWTYWMHRGVLRATSDGRLCLTDAKTFLRIVRQFDHLEFDPREYAIGYVKMLNDLQSAQVTITDLKCEGQEELIQQSILANAKKGAGQWLGMFGNKAGMMDSPPQQRGSVLFTPAATTKIKRSSSTWRFLK